jgi:hypothetical protein
MIHLVCCLNVIIVSTIEIGRDVGGSRDDLGSIVVFLQLETIGNHGKLTSHGVSKFIAIKTYCYEAKNKSWIGFINLAL